MNVSAVNSYRYGNYVYSHIAPPLPNRAEITMGMMKSGSSDPLYISNTAYGANANAINSGQRYVTSAETLAESNMINNTDHLDETKSALRGTIGTENNINKTQSTHLSEANINYSGGNPFLNLDKVNTVDAKDYAAVKADYNVSFSVKGNEALTALNNLATRNYLENNDLSEKVDGNIHLNTDFFKKVASFNNAENSLTNGVTDKAPTFLKSITGLFSANTETKLRKERLNEVEKRPNQYNISS